MKRLSVWIAVCLFFSTPLIAQQKAHNIEKDYAKKPLWINMMEDPNVNYFEIDKAYTAYWQHHTMPETEHDIIGEKKERDKHPSKRAQRKADADNDMRMAVKKYEWWREQMLPYVQPDGHILSTEERLQIWKQQQNEQQKTNK